MPSMLPGISSFSIDSSGAADISAGATRSLMADSTTVLVPQWWFAPPSEWGNGVRTVEPAESTVKHFVNIRKGKDVARKIQLTWLLSRSWPLALTRVMIEEQRQDMAAKENRKLQQKKNVQQDGQKDVQKKMVQKDGQKKKVQKDGQKKKVQKDGPRALAALPALHRCD